MFREELLELLARNTLHAQTGDPSVAVDSDVWSDV